MQVLSIHINLPRNLTLNFKIYFVYHYFSFYQYILHWLFPGPLEISNCMAKWNFEPNGWQLYSKMEIFIHQMDQYGNLVPGLYEFDAEVVEKETNLSIPVADLHFEEVMAGIQLFSFSNSEPGNFSLTVYDSKHNKSISNMPYAYTVFVGVCYLLAKFFH